MTEKKKPAAKSRFQQNNPEPEPKPEPAPEPEPTPEPPLEPPVEEPTPVDPEPEPEPVDEGENTEVEAEPLKDFSALQGESDARMAAMRANPDRRGDPDLTYSAFVSKLLHGHEAALSLALKEAADVWLKKSEETKIGEKAKKKLLAYKVLDGQFDRQ